MRLFRFSALVVIVCTLTLHAASPGDVVISEVAWMGTTGSSANEICYQLGFKDPAYFSRFFQRYAQAPPGEYRLRQSGLR